MEGDAQAETADRGPWSGMTYRATTGVTFCSLGGLFQDAKKVSAIACSFRASAPVLSKSPTDVFLAPGGCLGTWRMFLGTCRRLAEAHLRILRAAVGLDELRFSFY